MSNYDLDRVLLETQAWLLNKTVKELEELN